MKQKILEALKTKYSKFGFSTKALDGVAETLEKTVTDETKIDNASGVIISITASNDIGLDEVDQASSLIAKTVHPDATIIWGAAFDENLQDEMKITVVATGFEDAKEKKAVDSMPASATETFDVGDFEIPDFLNRR